MMRAVMSSKVGPVRHRIIAPAVHFRAVCHTLCPTRGFATTNQQSQFCHSGTPLPHLLDTHTTDSGVTRYAVCVQPRLPRVRGVAGCGVLSVAAHSRERGVPGALHFTANPRALHNHSPRDTTPRRPDSSPSVCVCVLPPPSQSVRESGPQASLTSCPVTMAQKSLREFDSKTLLSKWVPTYTNNAFSVSDKFVQVYCDGLRARTTSHGSQLADDVADDGALPTVQEGSTTPRNTTGKYKSLLSAAEDHPWLNTEKLVVKVDQLIKRRGKAGLLLLNASLGEANAWIEAHSRSTVCEQFKRVCGRE